MMKRRAVPTLAFLALLPLLLIAPTPADAQRPSASDRRGEHVAGDFDYYTLVLSWSPTYCAGLPRGGERADRDDLQCAARGRPFAFVLHGLWPQYARGYPERCRTRFRPFVPQRTIDSMLDIMPSPGLVIHEYRKHGTCSGLEPDGYYELSRRLYGKIRIPGRFVLPEKPQTVGLDQVIDEFIDANPGLRPDMLAIACGGPGNRMREVRICFSREGEFQACGSNENQRRLCSAQRMYVPPVRASASPASAARPAATERGERREEPRVPPQGPLPGPR